MSTPKSILCIHQGAELYGSDRMFVMSVAALRERYPKAKITIVLPNSGPLIEYLEPVCDEIIYQDQFVLRRVDLGVRFLLRIPQLQKMILQAYRLIRKSDLVYISTILITCFSLASRLVNVPRFVHMHEMPLGFEGKVFSRFLKTCRLHGIAISQAVADSLYKKGDHRVTIVHNGINPPKASETPWKRADKLKILMIGRFNGWKGQNLLVQALGLLSAEELSQIEVRFVGSCFRGQEHFLEELKELCIQQPLGCEHSFHDFTPTAGDCFAWSDLVAVPSTKPEPFGLVAIEAMAYEKPVIAAQHGGLAEILDEKSGVYFTPNSADSLAKSIQKYLHNRELCAQHGKHAKQFFDRYYTQEAYTKRFVDAIEGQLQSQI